MFNITFGNFSFLMGILGISLVVSSIWSFRTVDLLAPRKTQLFQGLIPMFVSLCVGVLVYLISIEIINNVIVNPVNRTQFMSYIGPIFIAISGLLHWLFDPWSKFSEAMQGEVEVEYLHPPKSTNKD